MNTIEFLNKVCIKLKLTRKKYDDNNVPNDLDDLAVIPFFGDLKHTYILSTIILNNYKRIKSSKYIILISYPGFEHLFPYVDEYWHPEDFSKIKQIYLNSEYFENKSEFYLNLLRGLNENFRSVVGSEFFTKLYNNKFQEEYWKLFGKDDAKIYIPMIPSSAIINKEVIKEINTRNNKIFILPSTHINSWSNGKYKKVNVPKNFYVELIKNLIKNKIFPVVWNNSISYDLNDEFKDKLDCLFINSENLLEILPIIRLTGCCLDIFNSLSKLANIARTPSIIIEERNKYFLSREYEIDDIIEIKLPGIKIYSFSNSVSQGDKNHWEMGLFNSINKSCVDLLPYIDREELPSTSEINKKINLLSIRKIKNKKLGTKFIKIQKLI